MLFRSLKGSDHQAEFDRSVVPQGYQILEITEETDNVFDWLMILEHAEIIVCVDSVIANLVDQLGLNYNKDCYFIPRSHIHLTPVLNGPWQYISGNSDVMQRIEIFR